MRILFFIPRYFTSRARFFRRRAFAGERELLARVGAKFNRLRDIPVRWLAILLVSALLHLLVLLIALPPQRESAKEVAPSETKLRVRFAASERPRPEKPPDIRQIEPAQDLKTAPSDVKNVKTAEHSKSGSENSGADSQPAPKPGVIGSGPGSRPSKGGGKGSGAGQAGSLKERGGSEKTEKAVERGLKWLAAHQRREGYWDCDQFASLCPPQDRCGSAGHSHYDVGVTSLALSAFLAKTATGGNRWKKNTSNAVGFLLRTQRPNGAFGREKAKFMYNQALATYALAHAYMQDPNPGIRSSLHSALDFIFSSQQPGGGWDYTGSRKDRNDLSITGWQILALHACVEANVNVPETVSVLKSAREMVRERMAASPAAPIYADRGTGAHKERPGLMPVALLSMFLCGSSPQERLLRELADHILWLLPSPRAMYRWEETGQSLYYWYYGTMALFSMGGKWWKPWNRRMKEVLLKLQRTTGHARGSWDPDPNWIGDAGGRIYSTSIAVLTLESYYRIEAPPGKGFRGEDISGMPANGRSKQPQSR